MIKIDSNHKVTPFDDGREVILNGLPLHYLVMNLHVKRYFNANLIIKHLYENYNIEINNEVVKTLDEYTGYSDNIFTRFSKNHPRNNKIEHSREYFNNQGRNYYMKFLAYKGMSGIDELFMPSKHNEIHHIHPLYVGGTNDLDNLINTSEYNHDLLHDNHLEDKKWACYQAVDYLSYLHNPFISSKNKYISNKYGFSSHSGKSDNFKADLYRSAVKEEMYEFYTRIGGG